jgi:hypothetical protein
MRCDRCGGERFTKADRDRQGRQLHGCAGCGRRVTARSASAFRGYRFPEESIAVAVRWYLRFRLSDADVTARTQSGGEHVRAACRIGWASERDDVVDLQRVLVHDDALDEQLQESLLLRDGRRVEPLTDPGTEGRDVREDGLGHQAIPAEAVMRGHLPPAPGTARATVNRLLLSPASASPLRHVA